MPNDYDLEIMKILNEKINPEVEDGKLHYPKLVLEGPEGELHSITLSRRQLMFIKFALERYVE